MHNSFKINNKYFPFFDSRNLSKIIFVFKKPHLFCGWACMLVTLYSMKNKCIFYGQSMFAIKKNMVSVQSVKAVPIPLIREGCQSKTRKLLSQIISPSEKP